MTLNLLFLFIPLLNIFFLGYSYSETSETDSGIKNINNTIDPPSSTMAITEASDFNGIINNALSSFNSDDYESAIKWYNKALTLDEFSIVAINGKGLSLSELGKHQEAIELYDRALKIDHKFLDALANKGAAFYRIGQYANALDWLNKALKIDPALLVSIYYKTRSLEELGESQLAAEYFKNASKIYYQTIVNKP